MHIAEEIPWVVDERWHFVLYLIAQAIAFIFFIPLSLWTDAFTIINSCQGNWISALLPHAISGKIFASLFSVSVVALLYLFMPTPFKQDHNMKFLLACMVAIVLIPLFVYIMFTSVILVNQSQSESFYLSYLSIQFILYASTLIFSLAIQLYVCERSLMRALNS